MVLPSTRRQLLCLAATTVGVGAGCSTASHSPTTDSSPSTPTPPSRVPASGECTAPDPPQPAKNNLQETTLTPKSYPSPPAAFTKREVGAFIRAYETAYKWNQILAGDASVPAGLTDLRLDEWYQQFQSGGDDFHVNVSYTVHYADDRTPTAERTPAPTGHRPTAVEYYVSKRGLIRAEEAAIDDGRVIECWETSHEDVELA